MRLPQLGRFVRVGGLWHYQVEAYGPRASRSTTAVACGCGSVEGQLGEVHFGSVLRIPALDQVCEVCEAALPRVERA
jgi:hypothetical protein